VYRELMCVCVCFHRDLVFVSIVCVCVYRELVCVYRVLLFLCIVG